MSSTCLTATRRSFFAGPGEFLRSVTCSSEAAPPGLKSSSATWRSMARTRHRRNLALPSSVPSAFLYTASSANTPSEL
uniref:Uncharacterized protein n=1 Tax=Arundo donax TaxID=35708 RepID=A0A0A9EEY4_ARUDO